MFLAACGQSGPTGGGAPSASTQAAQAPATATATASAAPSESAAATASSAAPAAPAGPCAEGLVEIPYSTHFCMNKTEVTLGEFKKCVDGGKCPKYKKPVNSLCNWHDETRSRHPMNCVTRTQAEEYCGYLGGRLPTMQEWEFASRDGENKPYAWGTESSQDEAEDRRWCHSARSKRSGTCEVGSFPMGATKAGLLDMTGNVAEWVTGADNDDKSKTCGRDWDTTEGWKAMEKCAGGYFYEAQVPTIGFRCVVPVK